MTVVCGCGGDDGDWSCDPDDVGDSERAVVVGINVMPDALSGPRSLSTGSAAEANSSTAATSPTTARMMVSRRRGSTGVLDRSSDDIVSEILRRGPRTVATVFGPVESRRPLRLASRLRCRRSRAVPTRDRCTAARPKSPRPTTALPTAEISSRASPAIGPMCNDSASPGAKHMKASVAAPGSGPRRSNATIAVTMIAATLRPFPTDAVGIIGSPSATANTTASEFWRTTSNRGDARRARSSSSRRPGGMLGTLASAIFWDRVISR